MGTCVTLKFSSTTSCVPEPVHCTMLCTLTSPSKDAVAKMPGVVGDHAMSKFQLPLCGSSVTTVPLAMSQQMVRLSLPALSISVGSTVHHASESTPFWWPDSSWMGDMLLRRSHSCRVVERSSSDATTSCVAMLGFHCSAEQRRRLWGSEKLMTGFCFLRSHTTVEPAPLVEARMCCTLLFHAR